MARTGGRRLNYMPEEYVVFDLETTGLSPSFDGIVEIAAVRVSRDGVTGEFQTLVNPQRPIPRGASAVNHITDQMVRNAPTIDAVLPRFLRFVGDLPLVGHNIGAFDLNFLARYADISNGYIDSLHIARRCLPQLPSRSMERLCWYYGIPTSGAHRALADCYMTNEVFRRMAAQFGPAAFR